MMRWIESLLKAFGKPRLSLHTRASIALSIMALSLLVSGYLAIWQTDQVLSWGWKAYGFCWIVWSLAFSEVRHVDGIRKGQSAYSERIEELEDELEELITPPRWLTEMRHENGEYC